MHVPEKACFACCKNELAVLSFAVNQLARTKISPLGPGDEKWNKTHAPQIGSVRSEGVFVFAAMPVISVGEELDRRCMADLDTS